MKESFLIVGLGSIGRRHLECLRDIKPDAVITIWRQHNKCSEVPMGADHVVFSLDEALAKKPTAAIISNPAPLHVGVGTALAGHGIHLLIEKPLSNLLDGVEGLLAVCRENECVLMVGYVLRFNTSLQFFETAIRDQLIGRVVSVRSEIGQYLPDWRPGSDYRQTVSAKQELGGGALLELSHELDYIRWIFGDVISVRALIENTGLLDIDTDDLVELIIEMKGHDGRSIITSVHMDMLQRKASRVCKAIGDKGILEWDAIMNRVRHYDAEDGSWRIIFESQTPSRNSMYSAQLESFMECIETGGSPLITGDDGRGVVEIIKAARQSSKFNKTVTLS